MNKKTIVYKAIFPNGKCYIGISNSFSQRKYQHKKDARMGKTSYFCRAIRKYGFENIIWEILFVFDTREEAETMEIKLISETKPNYNIAKGGNASPITEETKKKISKKLSGIPLKSETAEKIKSSLRKRYANKLSGNKVIKRKRRCKPRSKDRDYRWFQKRNGRNRNNQKIFKIIAIYHERMSIPEVARSINLSRSAIVAMKRSWEGWIEEEGF